MTKIDRQDIAAIIVDLIGNVTSLLRTSSVLIAMVAAVTVYMHGIEYLVALDIELIRAALGIIIALSIMLNMVWPLVKKVLVPHWYHPSAGTLTASGISLNDAYFSSGRRLSDIESREKKCIPWEEEKITLELLADQIAGLSGYSEIHDARIAKLLGIERPLRVTANTEAATELVHVRYGGVLSELHWDVEMEQDENSAWICTLKTRKDDTSEYIPVEKAQAIYAPVAIILAVIKRETRLWLSRE